MLVYACSCGAFTVLLSAPDRGGYEAAAKHFVASDLDVNLSGRSFMITGANSGIGKATAQEIANRGECSSSGVMLDFFLL